MKSKQKLSHKKKSIDKKDWHFDLEINQSSHCGMSCFNERGDEKISSNFTENQCDMLSRTYYGLSAFFYKSLNEKLFLR